MVTFLEAEKANQVADQIVTAATRLNRYYASRGGHIEADDLQQQMWLHLMERQHDQGFLARPVNEIVKMLTWRAQGWARAEFKRHTNRIYSYDSPIFPIHHHVQDILTDEHDQTWELIALEIDTDTYTDPHLPELIERALASLEGTSLKIARSLMAGRTKSETAKLLKTTPSNVSQHLPKIKQALSQVGLS